jgi:hypothetical protein
MKYIITLDEKNHIYQINGKVVPSVSQILDTFFPFKGNGLIAERASQFGRAVHEAIKLDIQYILDYKTLDDNLKPYLEQFKRLNFDNFILSETPLYSKKYNFAGTPDLLVPNSVIEIKTGQSHPKYRLQASAYLHLWNCNNPKNKFKEALVVYLDGSDNPPQIIKSTKQDFTAFLNCLNLFNWKKVNNV